MAGLKGDVAAVRGDVALFIAVFPVLSVLMMCIRLTLCGDQGRAGGLAAQG
jgi:hypothetical protein